VYHDASTVRLNGINTNGISTLRQVAFFPSTRHSLYIHHLLDKMTTNIWRFGTLQRHMQKNHCSWERTKGGDFICCWINCTFRSTSGGQAMLDHLIIDHVKFSGQSLHRFCVCGGFFKPADESAHRKVCVFQISRLRLTTC
jgi:hypothetical protein